MREVAVTEGDKVAAQMKFGFSVNTHGVGDLVKVVDAIDDKQVDALCKEYESTYEMNGYPATTSVAVDQYKEVNGILVNEKFSQRLEMGQMNFYSNYKAKEILVDSAIDDDVFTMK